MTSEPPLQDALHQMHATASRSTALTTFDDLTAPPLPTSSNETKTIELVHGGLSSLYSRLKASVGASAVPTGNSSSRDTSAESLERQKLPARASSKLVKSPAAVAATSPVVVSLPSSRLQSPLAPSFPEHPLPPSRDSNASSSAVSNKASLNGSKSSLATVRSRPSIAPSVESARTVNDDEPFTHSPVSTTSTSKPHGAPPLEPPPRSASSIGLASASRTQTSSYMPTRDDSLRRQRNQIQGRGEGSESSEEDLVLVEGATAAESSQHPYALDTTTEGLTKVTSRPDHQYKSSISSTQHLRKLSDVASEPTEKLRVTVTANAQTPVLAPAPQRPPLVQVGPSHLPGYRPSRASSSDGLSSIITSTTVRSPTRPSIEQARQRNTVTPLRALPRNAQSRMQHKIIDRDFWMKDENAKECFKCGDAFSTFRRKHHCRTCGQIFDSKCTSLVDGKLFGQSGNLRVCKPCEGIIYGDDDDSSIYTEDEDQASLYERDEREYDPSQLNPSDSDHTKIGTPTISIPMSRKAGSEKKRRSAVIEVAPPTLPRPSSSRSLRSLGGRPRSSSHKRHPSKHQHMRNPKYEDRAPFHHFDTEGRNRSALPAFHHDNIIDPDLAPFMSDEDSSEDEQLSIFAALSGDMPSHNALDGEKGGLGGILASMRRGKSRGGDRSVVGAHARDTDNLSVTSRHFNRHPRKRNLSVSSITHRPSPRRSKSNSLLKPFGAGFNPNTLLGPAISPQPSHTSPTPPPGSKITRSASMQGGNAPQIELNQASLQHVRKLLKQMLQDAGVAHVSSWEKALVPILLRCTDDVNPDLHRGDDIDIRNYIKLKKIVGGKPRDTSYISGVVFRKNIALKSMPRNISHPRILIITFAVEYARHQTHFMSLEPVIAQEKEYLRNLVGRIAALNPNVVLVQRNVSGLALEFLEQAGIAVAYNVKETVLNAVARCTQCKSVSSVDQLADTSRLGRCGSFDVKTYVHRNVRRTYIFLSGCQPDLGCTIALRGDESANLAKLKHITEFMCYVVFNLKLETCLMRDEFVLIPAVSNTGTLATGNQESEVPRNGGGTPVTQEQSGTADHSSSDEEKNQVRTTDGQVTPDLPVPSYYSEVVEKHRTKILSASPFVQFMQPYLLNKAREYEKKLEYLKKLRDQYTTDEDTADEQPQKFELVQPEMVHVVVEKASRQVREFLHAVHASEYDKALHNYMTQRRQWEAYLATNMDVYDPFNHQRIAVLYSVVNTTNSTPCIGPEIIALNFYQEHDYDDGFTPDCTLGQYVEDLCHSANLLCEVDGCNRRMLDHSRQYVHAEGQMSVIVQNSPSRIKGLQNTILMWSCCRVCGQETQVIPMSDSTWKYSFAKYLELTFWSTELHPRAGICPHDIHKNHVRYFGFNNMALRIQYDAIQLYEVIVPRPIVTWKVDSDLRLKNDQFLKIEERLDRFMASVRSRIKGIHVESVIPEKVEACRAEVERLMKRANDEHEWLRRKLQNKYMNSKYYEIIPLNRAIRAIQEKAIAWDETFMDFEQQFFPSEKDIRRLATLQLKKLFLERDESTSSLTSVEEGSEAVEEPALNEKNGPLALAPVPSSMSPERAHDMLTSVVEEHQSGKSSKPVDDSEKQVEGQESVSKEAPTSHNLPIPTPMEAVERDEVRHLDLAVASGFSESPVVKDESLVKTPTLPAQCTLDEPESPTPIALPKTNPIDEVLGEAANNAQASPPPQQTAFSSLESKIPRLVDTIRREAATPKRPALLTRTQSQPGNTAKHNSAPSKVTPTNGPDSPKGPLGGEPSKVFDRISERLVLSAFKSGKGTSKIPRSIPLRNQREYSKVSKLAEHFEQLSKEFQKERMRERRNERNRQMRAYPLASSKPIVEVYKDVHEAVQEENPSDEDAHVDSSLRASIDNSTLGDSNLTETTGNTTTSSSPVEERHPKDGGRHASETGLPTDTPSQASDVENEVSDAEMAPEEVPLPDSIASSDILSMTDSQLENSLELPKHEKNTLMKMLTSFWSERSASGWVPLDYPFAQIEHVWEDSDIIVREDEPSSIIALALSNPDYLARLQSFREPVETANGMETLDQSIQRNLLRPKNSEIRYSFTNRGVKAQCKIFYAQSFDALRQKCGVADRFVESLSRCSKWDSKGGKSKSIFLKTLDDRFVLKSLSPIETQAFFRFGPNYFDFTHQNLFKGLPSVIAKMFGLFQVQIKTPTGRDFDWFMLVMENLFYDREPNRRYDLKGSMRNRKIESTGERDEVLLDENLVDIIYSETPIFVREHTKKLLKASVWNDTLFLSHNNVMDYSLMAGFDDTNREIIVGIIDCIRTYTWDKKLESWIKDRGKNKPTITSPRDYRNRFRIAMEKYILQAPNCWYQFQARVVGVGVERHAAAAHGSSSSGVGNAADARETKTVVLREADERRRRSHQVLDVEGGGEVEKAAARMM